MRSSLPRDASRHAPEAKQAAAQAAAERRRPCRAVPCRSVPRLVGAPPPFLTSPL